MEQDRLQHLLHRHFDQVLTPPERGELEQMLLASPRARDAFWDCARWHALLRQWGEAEWGRLDAEFRDVHQTPASRKIIPVPTQTRRRPLLLALAASVALVASLLIQHDRGSRAEHESAAPSNSPKGVAVLTRAADVVWTDTTEARQAGQSLPPGWLRLQSGAVQVEFARGARVVIEGPAEFQLVTENEGVLRSGRVRAHVPEPAKGFKISAPGLTVVDRGTEFACNVPPSGGPEVHVFRGEVDVNLPASGGVMQSLRENQALRLDQGQTQRIASDPGAFLSEQALARRVAEQVRLRIWSWRKASNRLGQSPDALVHLDFEPEGTWQRSLENRATNSAARSGVSIIGCDWEYGRWPGKLALEFKRPDDRLRLAVPGSFDSLTLLAWVRVNSLPRKPQALLMSDSPQRGALQWFLCKDGSLAIGIHVAGDSAPFGWRQINSAPVIKNESLGAWMLLATVLDGTSGLITHYCDGQPVGSADSPVPRPLRPGTCELGNWAINPAEPKWAWLNSQKPDDYIRHFEGRLDEFTILSVPLPGSEIARLYEAGRPGDSTVVPGAGPVVKAD